MHVISASFNSLKNLKSNVKTVQMYEAAVGFMLNYISSIWPTEAGAVQQSKCIYKAGMLTEPNTEVLHLKCVKSEIF